MKSWLLQRSRPWKVLATFGVLSALILAFVPLFNIVGYESAAFYGVIYGLSVGYLRFDELTVHGWEKAFVERVALVALPFGILTANAVLVRNCSYVTGVKFWLFIPVISIAISTTLGWLVRKATGERRKLGHALIAAVTLLTVADFGLRLALEPPIIGFHWFLGYFSGSIYDEALNLPKTLVAYRITHLLAISAILLGYHASATRSRKAAAVAVILAIAAVWNFGTRMDAGVDLDRSHIVEKLGGVVESEHFIIYYPASPPFSHDVDRLVEDHEFRYAEMKQFFGTDPVELRGEKVRSFVYANPDQKGALMGARRTLVAKIWLREMHILWRHYGDHMLAHELAHVFTEPFGAGPLRLSSRGWVFTNMGLVEGVATAADWNTDALDPHKASAALRRLKKAPDITSLVGASGFWTQSSGRAYTLMGSFVRWLVAVHGIEKFREAYGHGEFSEVYETSEEELVKQWGEFVDALELSEQDLELARYLYDRKSIFEKVCARTIGDLRVRANRFARASSGKLAIETMEQVLRFDPNNVEYRLEFAQILLALDDERRAQEVLDKLLSEDLDPSQHNKVLALLGDVHWRSGDRAAAGSSYEECLRSALPMNDRRLLLVKSQAVRNESSAEFTFAYLLEDEVGDDIRVFFPSEWARRRPDDPLAQYLLGRRLWAGRQWQWAEQPLRAALNVKEGPLRDEAYQMLVQTLHFAGKPTEAAALLRVWIPSSAPYAAARDEWSRRVAWKSRNRVDAPGR